MTSIGSLSDWEWGDTWVALGKLEIQEVWAEAKKGGKIIVSRDIIFK